MQKNRREFIKTVGAGTGSLILGDALYGFSGGTGIAVRGMGGALLVARQDMPDLVLAVQGVIDVQYGTAGVTEYVLDALVLQRTDKDICTGQFQVGCTPGIGLGPLCEAKKKARCYGHTGRASIA